MSSPDVEILLAVYRPDWAYLAEQLDSLNAQKGLNLRLLALDDSADVEVYRRLQSLLEAKITAFPFELHRNERNLGATGAFARLTELATAPVLAYCDQDDRWLPDKIASLYRLLGDPGVTLAYCNQSIIDAAGQTLHPTLQHMRRRFVHHQGTGLFPYFLLDNCVTGCCMMTRREVAVAALPFARSYVQDQWIALFASARGRIAYEPRPLVEYRLHGGNVVGMASLAGIMDRESYVRVRLDRFLAMLDEAAPRFPEAPEAGIIEAQRRELSARKLYLTGHRLRGLPGLLRYGLRRPSRLAFELLLGLLPESLARRLIRFGQTH